MRTTAPPFGRRCSFYSGCTPKGHQSFESNVAMANEPGQDDRARIVPERLADRAIGTTIFVLRVIPPGVRSLA